ncbi:MAG: tetratricopeptide repeat protein [Anaerolineae bacterium]|nr:tetratricopeptide repeat protein [Anaerolineae bacterium]
MAKRKQRFKYEVTKKLEDLRLKADVKLVDAAKFFGYKSGDTIREWETGISRCPDTKRHILIDYLLNKLGLGQNEQGIKVFLQIWEDLVVMTWGRDNLSLEELAFYVPEKIDIISKLFESLTSRPPLQPLEPVRYFTSRTKELEQLLEVLQPGAVITLIGPGGIGKTALAAEAVHQLTSGNTPPERFPDGIVTFNFYEDRYADNALKHIARSFNEKIDKDTLPTEAVRRALSGKQALLILEGAENADDLNGVLAERNQCGVLITTRKREHAILGEQQFNLYPLTTVEGVALLQKWGKAQSANESVAKQICKLVGGLPLAIRLAGSYMDWRNEDATSYLEWMKDTPLEALDHGKRRLQSVPILLEKSVAQLHQAARQLLQVVGMIAPAPFDQKVISEALAIPSNRIRRPLDELINYSLLDPVNKRYKVSHTLIHTYARGRMEPPIEVGERLATYYNNFIDYQSKRGLKGYKQLDSERTHLMAVLDLCVTQENWPATANLAYATQDYLDIQGFWTERLIAAEVGLKAAKSLRVRQDESIFLSLVGNVYRDLGQVEQAIERYEQALAIDREVDDRYGEGHVLGDLGNAYSDIGQMEQAIDCYEQALHIFREFGDRHGEAVYLGNLGSTFYDLGQPGKAIEYYEQALTITRTLGNQRDEANHLNCLGNAYSDLGQVEQAIDYYEQALNISRELGDRSDESNCLGNLGLAYSELGQVKLGVKYYEQALTIARDIGYRRGESRSLGNLGLAYCALGQTEKGITYYQEALAISREIGARHEEGADLGNLGNAYVVLGQLEKAVDYYEQALNIAREIGDRRREGIHLGNLGSCFSKIGQIEETMDYYEQALNISREIGDRRAEAADLGNLGIAFSDLGYPDKAFEYYRQALAIAREVGDRHNEADILGNLANDCRDQGQVEQAIEYRQQALKLAREIGDRLSEAYHLGNLGDAYRERGQVEQAKQYLQQSLSIFEELESPSAEQIRGWLKELGDDAHNS